MKNRVVKALISVLLIGSMLLTACASTKNGDGDGTESESSGQNDSQDSTEGEGTSDDGNAEADYDPLGKYEEPITITSVKAINPYLTYDESIEGLESPMNNLWLDVYRDELGIELEYLWTADESVYEDKWNAMLADGEVPDIGYVPWSIYQQLLKADMVEDMTDYIENYASDEYKEEIANSPDPTNLITVDGRIMGLPTTGVSQENVCLLWIRKDWLEAVDMPVPTTMDELVATAKAFKEANLGGDNTIGFPISKELNNGLIGCRGFFNAFGAHPDIWLEGEDGTLEYGIVQPEMKEALKVLQELYAEGLIQEDFAVQNSSQALELVASEQAGMFFSLYWAAYSAATAAFESDDWIVTSVPSADGSPSIVSDSTKTFWFFYVKKGFEHPEAAVKMVNLGLDIRYNWPDGMKDYYIWEDGTSAEYARFDVWHFRPWEQLQVHEEIKDAILTGNMTTLVENNKIYYDVCKAHYENPESVTGADRLAVYNYGIGGGYDVVGDLKDEGRILTDQYNGILSNDAQAILNDVNTLLWAEYSKIIMGQDIDTFEAAVEDWYNNGGDEVVQIVNEK